MADGVNISPPLWALGGPMRDRLAAILIGLALAALALAYFDVLNK